MSLLSEKLQEVIDLLENWKIQVTSQQQIREKKEEMSDNIELKSDTYKPITSSGTNPSSNKRFHPFKEPNLPQKVSFNCLNKNDNILFLPKKYEELLDFSPSETLEQSQQHFITKMDDNIFDCVVSVTTLPFAPMLLKQIKRVLKTDGKFAIQGPKEGAFKKSLLFAGFRFIKEIEIDDTFCQWECINCGPIKSVPLNSQSNNNVSVWSFANNNSNNINNELVDEDKLLDNETEKVIINKNNKLDDCGIGSTRKPCKNCTCGRKEEYNNNNSSNNKVIINNNTKDLSNFQSSCGNCHLGDAFRCSGCPYLGKPAFDPNKQKEGIIKLNTNDDIVLIN